jgi:hypothetical protein
MTRTSLMVLPALALVAGCTAEIPSFDDDAKAEVCGGSVCFAPDYVSVRRWGDDEVTLAAWRGSPQCELPRTGQEPIAGHALILELKRPRPGARLPIVIHELDEQTEDPHACVHALRVDPESGKALADEEGVSGEVTILDIDSATGRLRVRIRARFSSGVSTEQVLDLAGWRGCSTQ